MTDTPETDKAASHQVNGCRVIGETVCIEFARNLERQRDAIAAAHDAILVGARQTAEDNDKLLGAVRALREAKGRHHTQLAAEALFRLASGLCPSSSPSSASSRK